jgi:Tfp pilus assembly protein PilO
MSPVRPFWMTRLLPAFGLLLAANLAGLALWTLPRGLAQRSALAHAQAAREEAARARSDVAALRERASAIRSNAEDVERFYRKHAGNWKTDLIGTLTAVEAMARAPGLKPGARGISREDVKEAPLERVTIALPLEGSYDQLVGFLRELETSSRFLTVDGIRLQTQREQRGVALQVELSTYLKLAPGVSSKGGRRAR